jgi:hypothetical protein
MAITYNVPSLVSAPVAPTLGSIDVGQLFTVSGQTTKDGNSTVFIKGDEGQFHADGLVMGLPVNKRVTTNNGLAVRQYFDIDTPVTVVSGDVAITFTPSRTA